MTTTNNQKHVRFALKTVIIFIEKEDRSGPWEMYARDRDRFARRINDINQTIGWIFSNEHRNLISQTYQSVHD